MSYKCRRHRLFYLFDFWRISDTEVPMSKVTRPGDLDESTDGKAASMTIYKFGRAEYSIRTTEYFMLYVFSTTINSKIFTA